MPGDTRAFAYAINDNGEVVGESTNASLFPRHGFVWTQAGGMVDLGNLGNNLTFVLAINNSGQVIGYSYTSGLIRAFSWTQGGGMVNIGLPSGFHSTPFAINNAGQIVGYAYNSSFVQHAFVESQRPSGGIVDLNDAVIASTSHRHMPIARCNQRSPRINAITMLGLLDFNLAQLIQPFGEGCGENLRHVLHHDDAGSMRRHSREDFGEGLCTTGGGPNSYDGSRRQTCAKGPRLAAA